MRFFAALILLAFPVAEIWLMIELGHRYGWLLLLYLIGIGLLGIRLIREEKSKMSGRMMQDLATGGSPIKALFGSARNIITGVLLILPGVITDVIAVILLLIPINQNSPADKKTPFYADKAANDDVIEGEFRRED